MMTATPTRPTPGGGLSPRSLLALIGAAIVLVATVVLVLAFGVARPPAVTSLADEPTPPPPGGVAWTSWDDGEECLRVASPDGEVAEPWCLRYGGGEVIGWDDEGIAVVDRGPTQELVVVDPVSGEVAERREFADPSEPRRPGAGGIDSRHDDGVLTVRSVDEDVVLWAVEAPENYRIDQGAISPDGDWAVLLDSVGRLLLVPADGSAAPRQWADTEASWQAPVWEGTPVDAATG